MNPRSAARDLTDTLRALRAGGAPKVRKRGAKGTRIHRTRNVRDARRAGFHPEG